MLNVAETNRTRRIEIERIADDENDIHRCLNVCPSSFNFVQDVVVDCQVQYYPDRDPNLRRIFSFDYCSEPSLMHGSFDLCPHFSSSIVESVSDHLEANEVFSSSMLKIFSPWTPIDSVLRSTVLFDVISLVLQSIRLALCR